MPKFLEQKLRAEASKKGFKGKRADRYVYGGMNNMGAMLGNKITAKGAAMERKHEKKVATQKRGVTSRRKGNQHIESETHSYHH